MQLNDVGSDSVVVIHVRSGCTVTGHIWIMWYYKLRRVTVNLNAGSDGQRVFRSHHMA